MSSTFSLAEDVRQFLVHIGLPPAGPVLLKDGALRVEAFLADKPPEN